MEYMVEIMEDFQQYIPTRPTTSEYQTCGLDCPVTVLVDDFTMFCLVTVVYACMCQEVHHSTCRHPPLCEWAQQVN